MCLLLTFSSCVGENAKRKDESDNMQTPSAAEKQETETEQNGTASAGTRLLYMGHASIRIITPEEKVIYIDPYAGNGYQPAADLILVTHDHFDHTALEKVANRAPDCRIITWKEALVKGKHQTFALDFATVEAVEAGYNRNHNVKSCVGYIITLSDGVSVYVSGDTSTTKQMPQLSAKQIDYAFYCCDGVYNMDLDEAAECAKLVGARHDIPYHVIPAKGVYFDRKRAERFDSPHLLVVDEGEEIKLNHQKRR
jgi:hypothetical protein